MPKSVKEEWEEVKRAEFELSRWSNLYNQGLLHPKKRKLPWGKFWAGFVLGLVFVLVYGFTSGLAARLMFKFVG